MTTLKDKASEVGEIIRHHPLHYLKVRVDKEIKTYSKVWKLHTTLDGKHKIINLSVIPHVYKLDETKYTDKELRDIKIGTEVLLPVFLQGVWIDDGILMVQTFPGRDTYAIHRDDWDKIILEM